MGSIKEQLIEDLFPEKGKSLTLWEVIHFFRHWKEIILKIIIDEMNKIWIYIRVNIDCK